MINFITNMQQASQVVSNEPITARALVAQWIADRNLDTDVESFFENFTVSNVSTSNGVGPDDVLTDGHTLSVYTKAVATGGVKSACS